MTIRCNIDSVAYSAKPTKSEIGAIINRLRETPPRSLTVREILDAWAEGKTICEGFLDGGQSSTNWVGQSIFTCDIDNEREGDWIDEAAAKDIATSHGLEWAFIYHTFRHGIFEGKPKFRIGFVVEQPITDRKLAKKMKEALVSLFPQADKSTVDLARRLFGTCHHDYEYRENVFLDVEKLKSFFPIEKPKPAIARKQSRIDGDVDLADAISSFDFASWVQTEYAGDYKPCGGDWLMKHGECPICGHNDCFTVREFGYHCKSSHSDTEGGNIITFLQSVANVSIKRAREIFKFDILGLSRDEERQRYALAKKEERQANRPPFIVDVFDAQGKPTGEEKVSAPLLYKHVKDNAHYFFVRDNAKGAVNRFWYSGGFYRLVPDVDIKAEMKGMVESYNLMLCNTHAINEAFNLLITDTRFIDDDKINEDENIVNFQNGVLRLDTLELLPHSPKYLITTQIPCAWRGKPTDTPIFDSFFDELTAGDEAKKRLLLEYIGVAISNIKGWRAKKALFLVGQGDTGKSQIKILTERILGSGNFSSLDLAELEARFGSSQIYGKRLAGSADVGYLHIPELKTFKKITGGDNIFAEFKGEQGFSFRFDGLLLFCCNELPKFGGDTGQWVFNRMLVVNCDSVIPPERQDKFLSDKMFSEREGIIYKALTAARAFIERGYRFTECEASQNSVTEWQVQTNTVRAFYRDCCEMRPFDDDGRVAFVDKISAKTLYRFYTAFCRDINKGYSVNERDFKRELLLAMDLPEGEGYYRRRDNSYFVATITVQTYRDYSAQIGFVDGNLAAQG